MKRYIVDIDGTLANISHRLHFIRSEPKQWDAFFEACSEDAPIQDVIDVVKSLDRATPRPQIIYLTGRPERVRMKTVAWLTQHGLPLGQLIMRKDGDYRADTTAKRELLERILAEGSTVAGVFEDRPSVCRVWREMGLTVFQMTHEEF